MTPASPDALLAADVERVAKGLTKTQRDFVLALGANWSRPNVTSAVTGARDPRLVERLGFAAGNPYRLTPLGLRVRAILSEEPHHAE